LREWVWAVLVRGALGEKRSPPTMLVRPAGCPIFNTDAVKKVITGLFVHCFLCVHTE
jgi:hypothetical protein